MAQAPTTMAMDADLLTALGWCITREDDRIVTVEPAVDGA
jgi:hypothetical protein